MKPSFLKENLKSKNNQVTFKAGLFVFCMSALICSYHIIWPPCFRAGAAHPDYLPAAPLDNHDDMTAVWQARLSRPVTDWQPIPAVIPSCLTPLHSSICHFSSSALNPLSPTPPFNYSSIHLCPETAESNRSSWVFALLSAVPVTRNKATASGLNALQRDMRWAVTVKSSTLNGPVRIISNPAAEDWTHLDQTNKSQ